MKKLLSVFIACLCIVVVASGANQDSGAAQAIDGNQTSLNQNNTIVPGNFEPIDKILGSTSRSRSILWDRYDTDGINGVSHAQQSVFGSQRDLLDDFEVPAGEMWMITGLNSLNLWNGLPPGAGSDFLLQILDDNGGTPGNLVATATTASYQETATGRDFFGRLEFELEYGFDPIVLGPGRYWIKGHIVGPDNCYWMVRADVIWGSPLWTDYEDFPPLQPGINIFGDDYDLAYQLTGELGGPVPVSDYAIFIGIFLILAFAIFRFRKMI